MREFRASAGFLVFLYSLLTFLTLGGLAVFMLGVTGARYGLAVWLLLPGLVLLGWLWSVYLHIPFIIAHQEDNTLEFKSFFRVITLSPGNISTVRRFLGMPWFLEIRHRAGKLVLTTFMTDMPELMALIQGENPAAEVSVG
jgi:hypothetical protein